MVLSGQPIPRVEYNEEEIKTWLVFQTIQQYNNTKLSNYFYLLLIKFIIFIKNISTLLMKLL